MCGLVSDGIAALYSVCPFIFPSLQALIQDQSSTSPSPSVDAPRGRHTNMFTYIINNNTIKGNYKPNFLAFLLQIINVLHIII